MRTSVRYIVLAAIFLAPCARADYNPFSVTGLLKDVFQDPTDPEFAFLYVETTNDAYYAVLNKTCHGENVLRAETSIGAQVTVTGQLVARNDIPSRPYSVREIRIQKQDDITFADPALSDASSLPDERSLLDITPDNLAKQLFHCIRGKVLAVWNGDAVLVKTSAGSIVEAELRQKPPPRCGETIDLVGLPETTLYHMRLNRASWRSVAPPDEADDAGTSLPAAKIVMDDQGHPRMDMLLHGKVIRVTGVVRSLPNAESGNDVLYLEDHGFLVPVNAEAAAGRLQDVAIGCTVEASGICVMDVDVWRPNAVFPRIRGYTLVTRRPADIRILAYPPWLTPQRMFAIVATLAALLLGILFWTSALRVQSERRGRQLAKEQILRAESDLKVHERTRLAVELHDALSQSLAAVALELKTVAALTNANPKAALDHLGIADRSLLSCRADLRNCLYDLRNDALEEKTMDGAIRRTLAPHIDRASLSIRFNVPRARISDNTAHAILCIIRELSLNALRHGRASDIKVAGALKDGKLLFSVRDNGCGFDPSALPGVRQGHFGLQGIRERILAFNGEFRIDSRPGAGTKATVAVRLPGEGSDNG